MNRGHSYERTSKRKREAVRSKDSSKVLKELHPGQTTAAQLQEEKTSHDSVKVSTYDQKDFLQMKTLAGEDQSSTTDENCETTEMESPANYKNTAKKRKLKDQNAPEKEGGKPLLEESLLYNNETGMVYEVDPLKESHIESEDSGLNVSDGLSTSEKALSDVNEAESSRASFDDGTEDSRTNQESEDPAKIQRSKKRITKPSLSLEEKMSYIHKLIKISEAYGQYWRKGDKELEELSKVDLSKPNKGAPVNKGVANVTGSPSQAEVNQRVKCVIPKDVKWIKIDPKIELFELVVMLSPLDKKKREFQPPSIFEGKLRDYQKDGAQWLLTLLENLASGILADEMGLGKTVQTIAVITHLVCKNVKGPFLIVAPLSTLPNWLSEFQRFCPKVPVILFHGNAVHRNKLKSQFCLQNLRDEKYNVKLYPVIITSYEIVLAEPKFFAAYKWRYLVVDEGHRLKNQNCQLSRLLMRICSTNRVLLTGTPIQNNLEELWALLHFLTPEIFGTMEEFESLISMEDLQSDTIVEQEIKEGIVTKLHQALVPFILRRMKKDVNLQLPPKKEVLVYAPMSKLQWDLYNATMDGNIFYHLGLVEEEENLDRSFKRKCTQNVQYIFSDDAFDDFDDSSVDSSHSIEKSKKVHYDKEGNQCYINLKMQNPMFQLRKLCNHPYLVQMPVNQDGCMLVNEEMINKSGKMRVLDVLLPRLKAEGHKVLLFSTMTKLLNIIEEYLIYRRYQYTRLDGSVKLEDRISEISKFMNDSETFIFLISTRAGSLGLNLVSADTVIIFDSDWNPQVDLQAQDRCHRIGQNKPVVVYRFVTKASVDEKIVSYAQNKRRLEKLVLHNACYKGNKSQKLENFVTVEELRNLLASKDYAKIVNTTQNVLSEKEVEDILDRSDMV